MSVKMDLSDAQMIVAVLRMESDLTRSLEDVKLLREELQRRLGVKACPTGPAPVAPAPAAPAEEPASSSASTSTEGSKKKRGPKPRSEMTPEEVEADKAKRAAKKAERAAKKAEEKPAVPVSDGEETEPEEGEIVEEKPKPAESKAEKRNFQKLLGHVPSEGYSLGLNMAKLNWDDIRLKSQDGVVFLERGTTKFENPAQCADAHSKAHGGKTDGGGWRFLKFLDGEHKGKTLSEFYDEVVLRQAKPAKEEKPKKEKKAKDPDAPKKAASAGVLAWNAFKEGIRAELKAKDPEAKIKSEDVMKLAKERKDADKTAYEAFVAKFKADHPSAPASSASSVVDDE